MIKVTNLQKKYQMGEVTVHALNGLNLTIEAGEFVAIMGPSGSGKSTLMHVLGMLDVPDEGSYELFGKEVSKLSQDELAKVRRDVIGFVFQQFNLLPRLNAAENVSLPMLYSKNFQDIEKAKTILERVGLGTRWDHKPNELSGGQQQRVAIARSLINDPRIIFADEPTGNLDSKSEKEIMDLLTELNASGITIILVSHEHEIAQYARRIVRMRDGVVQSDEKSNHAKNIIPEKLPPPSFDSQSKSSALKEFIEHFKQGVKSLWANKVRTGLSMLGILIGVAAVIAMLAIGKGAQDSIKERLSSLGSNLLVLRSNPIRNNGVSVDSTASLKFRLDDVSDLKKIPTIRRISPTIDSRIQTTYENKNWSTNVLGANPEYSQMRAYEPIMGRFFNSEETQSRARVAVIGLTIYRELFSTGGNPIGETIRINKIPFQIIGVLPEKGSSGFRDMDDLIIIPINTAMYRVLGKKSVETIEIEVKDSSLIEETIENIKKQIIEIHHLTVPAQINSIQIRNMAEVQAAISETGKTMSVLLASIAAISLLVGGIGIMNIMLVSVTERTREIGLRKAIGARRVDILSQFLIEAVVVSITGGTIGILLGWLVTVVLERFADWAVSMSLAAVFISFFFSATIGILFGIWPAQKASKLHPIEALRHD